MEDRSRIRRRRVRKKVHVTFSIPEDVVDLLHSVVEKRGMSDFATRALEAALEEGQQSLKRAYLAANEDEDRKETIEDWSRLDGEGWE